jgi:hypothetical protein
MFTFNLDEQYHCLIIDNDNSYLLDGICQLLLKESIIGLDTETSLTNVKPSDSPPTIIQLGINKYTYIINVASITPKILLETPNFITLMRGTTIKVGFDISVDVRKLALIGVEVSNWIDNQTIAELLGETNLGMDFIANKLIGYGKLGTMKHNWDKFYDGLNYDRQMAEYAARDVILSIKCFKQLMEQYTSYITPFIYNALYNVDDLFKLSIIAANNSLHKRSNTNQLRALVHEIKPIVKYVLEALILKGLIFQRNNIYNTVLDGTMKEPITQKPVQFIPLTVPESQHPSTMKLKDYQIIEKERPLTSEENIQINLLNGQLNAKVKERYVDPNIDPEIVRMLPPKTQNSELKSFQDLLSMIQQKEQALKTIDLTKNNEGIVRAKYKDLTESLHKCYRILNERLKRYNLTPEQVGITLL